MAIGGRHGVDDRVHGGQVGIARVGRRRADGHEQQPGVLQRILQTGREVHAVAVLGDQLLQPRLPDGDPALAQALDLGRVDVDALDVGAERGEARRRHQPDVARADDAYRLAGAVRELMGRRSRVLAAPSRRSEAAMAIIFALESDWVSVFATQ